MKCTWNGCTERRTGKKYCQGHAAEARRVWRENRQKEKDERETRYADFAAAYHKAMAAGRAAAEEKKSTLAMYKVTSPSGVDLGYEPFPVCGFAWVNVRPGNSSFAHWLKKNAGADKHYYGGVSLWISAYGQSMDLKYAHAAAMAESLRESLGIDTIYPGSRMD